MGGTNRPAGSLEIPILSASDDVSDRGPVSVDDCDDVVDPDIRKRYDEPRNALDKSRPAVQLDTIGIGVNIVTYKFAILCKLVGIEC